MKSKVDHLLKSDDLINVEKISDLAHILLVCNKYAEVDSVMFGIKGLAIHGIKREVKQ